ncbi:MAG: hypothetical protein ACREXX_23740 [Gammaproteobacteria bacterium]
MVFLFVVGRFQPVPEATSVMVTEIAIGILVLLFATRMVLAPYWIFQDEAATSQAEEARLKQQLAEAQKNRDDRPGALKSIPT